MSQTELAVRLARLRQEFDKLEKAHGRAPGSSRLLAVSKRHSSDAMREAYAQGQHLFGENFLQEAREKQRSLADCAIEWHFIGAVQSNKTADIATHFDWVHTVDRRKIAERLNRHRAALDSPLNVLVQVNISGEQSKNGILPESFEALVSDILELPNLRYRGVMALPAPSDDESEQRRAFRRLRELAESVGTEFDTLSMGTSQDYAAAIAEGATLVRLGTAVFGPRPAT